MLRLYRGLLYLYPARYRREFAEEMAFVFGQAERDAAERKFRPSLWFRVHEVAGLLSGAFREHLRHAFDETPAVLLDRRPVELAEPAAEGDQLRIAERLVADEHHRMRVPSLDQLRELRGIEGPQIDAADDDLLP